MWIWFTSIQQNIQNLNSDSFFRSVSFVMLCLSLNKLAIKWGESYLRKNWISVKIKRMVIKNGGQTMLHSEHKLMQSIKEKNLFCTLSFVCARNAKKRELHHSWTYSIQIKLIKISMVENKMRIYATLFSVTQSQCVLIFSITSCFFQRIQIFSEKTNEKSEPDNKFRTKNST